MFLLGLLVLGLLPVAFMAADVPAEGADDDGAELPMPDMMPEPVPGPSQAPADQDGAGIGAARLSLAPPDMPDTVDGAEADLLRTGGTEADLLEGGNGHDTLLGQGGADTIEGGAGNDVIHHGGDYAGPTASVLFRHFTDGAADVLSGGDGADRIVMDGPDTAWGGAGADEFHLFATPGAVATIADFDPAEDRLVVMMPPGPALTSVEVRADDTGATVSVDGLDVARLDGVRAAVAALSHDNQYSYQMVAGAQIMVLRFENVTS